MTRAPANAKIERKTKWPTVGFAFSNQNDVQQLKENAKKQNALKATQTWVKVS